MNKLSCLQHFNRKCLKGSEHNHCLTFSICFNAVNAKACRFFFKVNQMPKNTDLSNPSCLLLTAQKPIKIEHCVYIPPDHTINIYSDIPSDVIGQLKC